MPINQNSSFLTSIKSTKNFSLAYINFNCFKIQQKKIIADQVKQLKEIKQFSSTTQAFFPFLFFFYPQQEKWAAMR